MENEDDALIEAAIARANAERKEMEEVRDKKAREDARDEMENERDELDARNDARVIRLRQFMNMKLPSAAEKERLKVLRDLFM
jgi:hypothetical protein